ncbi:tripartite tricarboxylate transporter permease [Desulforhopalus singaporensis]|uniref:Putative tricarboxylic transport membrane protein n=1 Tax=Desulforhopalus singaporensis TaxID=91360 RepID=A0A1H0PKA9_9BACT|nr:tripartite tricarboxylate transporter permease [Desulforhopalus singaporensis]SDP05210.1 putative tricarboxylic transport membrane protein [Desulforhopalus singaporensis]
MIENILQGFATIFSVGPIVGIIIGVIVGIIFGAIPGISAIMAIAIMLPLTFYVEPVVGITMLLAVYKAGIYGGSISAILINTPGAAAAFLTAQDGHALTRMGKSGKALCMALYASVTGEMLSTLVLIFVAAPISLISLKAGPIERVYLLFFAFTVIGSVTGESISRGLLSTCLGMLFATVGMSSITGATRFTFGIPELMSGFTFTPMLIGVLVMPEVIIAIRQRNSAQGNLKLTVSPNPEDNRISWREYRSVLGTIIKSSGIGTFIGSLPGLGSTTAAFLAYGEARRTAKNPEKFGNGSIRGIAAAESANNAVCGAAMIPMLTLSIPGDDVTALLFGAFLIQGITPGPTIFFEHTQVIYGIFAGFLLTDFFLLFFARIGFKFWTKIASVPRYYIFPCVTIFAFAGSFTTNQNINDVLLLILFTMFGFGMRLVGLNPAAYLIGFILTPMLEQNMDQAVAIVGDNYSMYFTTPFAWIFTGLAALSVYSTIRQRKRAKVKRNDSACLEQGEAVADKV